MIPQDVQAAMRGNQQGKMALQGVLPSSTDAGGAPPGNMDQAAPLFDFSRRALLRLINYLHQNRDEQDANRVTKLMTTLQDISIERRKKMADKMSESSPMSSAAGLHAMGSPQ